MSHNLIQLNLELTKTAVKKIKTLINPQEKKTKFRVYITGGGCSGFQYGFAVDEKINDNDFIFEKFGITIIIDPMSAQYLIGALIDYVDDLQGSKFIVINPNAKLTCSCGSSFNI